MSISDGIHLTKIQSRMMEILEDGEIHCWNELLSCLQDTEAEKGAVIKHIYFLRKVLNPYRLGVISVDRQRGEIGYRLVRFLNRHDE